MSAPIDEAALVSAEVRRAMDLLCDVERLTRTVVALRAEHTAALDAARRDGAEGMRRAAGEVCHDVYLEDPSAAVAACINAIRALPLDAPGGGS